MLVNGLDAKRALESLLPGRLKRHRDKRRVRNFTTSTMQDSGRKTSGQIKLDCFKSDYRVEQQKIKVYSETPTTAGHAPCLTESLSETRYTISGTQACLTIMRLRLIMYECTRTGSAQGSILIHKIFVHIIEICNFPPFPPKSISSLHSVQKSLRRGW
jgi:hypothetical protein